MCGWIGERADDFQELEYRAWPPMRQNHRERVLLARADPDEVNVDPVDLRQELGKGVELGFGLAPVIAAAPVPDQCLKLGQWRTLRPVGDHFLAGPARFGNPLAK